MEHAKALAPWRVLLSSLMLPQPTLPEVVIGRLVCDNIEQQVRRSGERVSGQPLKFVSARHRRLLSPNNFSMKTVCSWMTLLSGLHAWASCNLDARSPRTLR